MPTLPSIAVVFACYALGCAAIPYYVVRWRTGLDLRKCGSGTVGSTNAGRLLGRKAYVALTLLDIAKGWAALAFAAWCGLDGWWRCAAGLAVVAGHLWPAQLGFHGGKGVATSYGVILFTVPWVALAMWVPGTAIKLLLRSWTPGAMGAFFVAPLLMLPGRPAVEALVMVVLLSAAVIICHRRNIREALQRRRARTASITASPAA